MKNNDELTTVKIKKIPERHFDLAEHVTNVSEIQQLLFDWPLVLLLALASQNGNYQVRFYTKSVLLVMLTYNLFFDLNYPKIYEYIVRYINVDILKFFCKTGRNKLTC